MMWGIISVGAREVVRRQKGRVEPQGKHCCVVFSLRDEVRWSSGPVAGKKEARTWEEEDGELCCCSWLQI